MSAEMGYTSNEIIAMKVNNFAIYSPSDENGNDRRTSLDEAHTCHQLESMRGTRRFLSSKYLLSSS